MYTPMTGQIKTVTLLKLMKNECAGKESIIIAELHVTDWTFRQHRDVAFLAWHVKKLNQI